MKASHDRDWAIDQAILPYAEIDNDLITIHNIRNFSYRSTTDYTPGYYDRTFDINKLKKTYFIVEPFSGYRGAAHTFVSFEFENNQFVSISAEIRKQKGELFSAVKGLFNQYELMYVIADERDVINLRANYRHDDVYVYPIRASIEKQRALFLDMIARTNELKETPEFYNTFFNNCTTNIAEHVNAVSPKRINWNISMIFPKSSDAYAYKIGLIDTELPFEEARNLYKINDRAKKAINASDFSVQIRK